ncbi:MAG: hypothetical protein HY055_00055 [Magnetospirillum sp.]|nr:hypothetical protein [Magnetospirillum sp.]
MAVERVASLGLGEFRRHLPYALRGLAHHWADERSVIAVTQWGKVSLVVEELEALTLSGALSLPRLRIAMAFEGGSEAQHAAFVAVYDRAFQRGGG